MNQLNRFVKKLNQIVQLKHIKIDEPMKDHTYFKVGGPVDIMVLPETFSQVEEIIKLCKKEEMPHYVIGNGSNLLVKDGGIKGLVIKLCNLNGIKIEGEKVVAQSGAILKDVCNEALNSDLTGLEFACGIPGSIGGAIAMNAGAYDGEVSGIIESALVVDPEGNIKILDKEKLELAYRNSAILKYGYTALEVTFKLQKGEHTKIKNRMDHLTIRRTEKQPLEYPSAGSTFKRPEGHFAAKLIEDSGLKGAHVGDAEVSAKHSGFIVNKGNATAADILKLIAIVQSKVKEKFDVELHTEVRIIGEERKVLN